MLWFFAVIWLAHSKSPSVLILVVMLLAFVWFWNATKIDTQEELPVFKNIVLCLDALSGRESASMATLFDMTYLLVYRILHALNVLISLANRLNPVDTTCKEHCMFVVVLISLILNQAVKSYFGTLSLKLSSSPMISWWLQGLEGSNRWGHVGGAWIWCLVLRVPKVPMISKQSRVSLVKKYFL